MADNSALALSLLALGKASQGGGGEPTEYLKSASVADNELTLTKKDGTTVVYEPDIPEPVEYTAGDGIAINSDNEIRTLVDGETIQFNEDGELEAIGGGSSDFYWCEYGTTTYQEIEEAVNNGKLPIFRLNSTLTPIYQLTNGGEHKFTAVYKASDGIHVAYYHCDTQNHWGFNGDTLKAISGINDGTNWTSLTIDGTTKAIPSGGGTSYTAGEGINIDNDTISVTDDVVRCENNIDYEGDFIVKMHVQDDDSGQEVQTVFDMDKQANIDEVTFFTKANDYGLEIYDGNTLYLMLQNDQWVDGSGQIEGPINLVDWGIFPPPEVEQVTPYISVSQEPGNLEYSWEYTDMPIRPYGGTDVVVDDDGFIHTVYGGGQSYPVVRIIRGASFFPVETDRRHVSYSGADCSNEPPFTIDGYYRVNCQLISDDNTYEFGIDSQPDEEFLENNILRFSVENEYIEAVEFSNYDAELNKIDITVWFYDSEIASTINEIFVNDFRHVGEPITLPIEAQFMPIDNDTITINEDGQLVAAGGSDIPTPPSADGNYVLKCSVVDGTPSYSWVAE